MGRKGRHLLHPEAPHVRDNLIRRVGVEDALGVDLRPLVAARCQGASHARPQPAHRNARVQQAHRRDYSPPD